MNKKTMLYIAGAVAVVGVLVWYTNSQAKKRGLANSNQKKTFDSPAEDEDESSSATGVQIGSYPCQSPNQDACKKNCESFGGTYNETGDKKCYKNGIAMTGGMFSGRVRERAMNKSIR